MVNYNHPIFMDKNKKDKRSIVKKRNKMKNNTSVLHTYMNAFCEKISKRIDFTNFD